ncbi:hypothetical protein CWI39_0526p0020 [Hamiltosporidium magnivora]|uniref:Uncharacterized protein n=2 Tax=Hamiltosporidium TaxID=1176354 RepID=A0A4Q9LI56_9MICR|nr:hypothetical protein CWI36_1092p0010 [Hamiltosporidium magnivora]TBU06255.1 hypothetical protein CWI39_0526p0020 [Hamiltosporidium magnivora]TBU07774.1 hypothetical protein CWI36_0229p0030 [Hamiltosporidium magnivora]
MIFECEIVSIPENYRPLLPSNRSINTDEESDTNFGTKDIIRLFLFVFLLLSSYVINSVEIITLREKHSKKILFCILVFVILKLIYCFISFGRLIEWTECLSFRNLSVYKIVTLAILIFDAGILFGFYCFYYYTTEKFIV